MLLLASNLKYLRKVAKVSQQDVASFAGIATSALSGYENEKFYPTADVLAKLCQFFQVDANDLLFKNLTGDSELNVESVAMPSVIKGNNVLVPANAQAQYLGEHDNDFFKKLTFVSIPGVKGDARTFEVVENTMTPFLMPGEYVACVASSLAEIESGRVYVIVSDRIQIAHVQIEKDRILCTPGNRDEFEPYRIPNNEIREIWEAKAKVTDRITDPFAGGYNPKRLVDLEEFLKGKFPDLIVTE